MKLASNRMHTSLGWAPWCWTGSAQVAGRRAACWGLCCNLMQHLRMVAIVWGKGRLGAGTGAWQVTQWDELDVKLDAHQLGMGALVVDRQRAGGRQASCMLGLVLQSHATPENGGPLGEGKAWCRHRGVA